MRCGVSASLTFPILETYDETSHGLAIAVSVVVFGGFLFLTIRRLRRMDVP